MRSTLALRLPRRDPTQVVPWREAIERVRAKPPRGGRPSMIVCQLGIASRELEEAMFRYEGHAGRGEDLIAAVAATTGPIEDRAESFSRPSYYKGPRDIRWAFAPDYPYAVIFEIKGEVAWVVAISHFKRRPGYWVRRKTP